MRSNRTDSLHICVAKPLNSFNNSKKWKHDKYVLESNKSYLGTFTISLNIRSLIYCFHKFSVTDLYVIDQVRDEVISSIHRFESENPSKVVLIGAPRTCNEHVFIKFIQ